jgi:hypothetical protein
MGKRGRLPAKESFLSLNSQGLKVSPLSYLSPPLGVYSMGGSLMAKRSRLLNRLRNLGFPVGENRVDAALGGVEG